VARRRKRRRRRRKRMTRRRRKRRIKGNLRIKKRRTRATKKKKTRYARRAQLQSQLKKIMAGNFCRTSAKKLTIQDSSSTTTSKLSPTSRKFWSVIIWSGYGF